MRRLLLLLPLLALTGCGSDDGPPPGPPAALPTAAPSAAERVQVRVGEDLVVTAEVADDPAERAVGLMGRTEVPPGTGMVFRYAQPSTGRFYMYRVPVPLTAVFARDGEVVGVVEMTPCPEPDPQACPTYGPDEPFDTVLETAPGTVAGRVAVGDRLTVG